jgi:hypothetical protein
MLRSIRQRLLGTSKIRSPDKAQHALPLRRLKFETLECRALLTASSNIFNAVSDSSFEVPVLPANTFQYAPASSAWQFSATAGITSDGSPFTAGNPYAPDGTQVALLEESGSISQSVYLNAGTYNLSFMAAQRAPDGPWGRHFRGTPPAWLQAV